MFPYVVLSWLLQTKKKVTFAVDATYAHWCKYGQWYNTTIHFNLNGPVFEYFFVTARQDIYSLMCGIKIIRQGE